MKTAPDSRLPSLLSDGTVSRVFDREGRTFTLHTNPCPAPATLSDYERSLIVPVCPVVDFDEVDGTEAVGPQPNPYSKRIGTRDRVARKVGRRKRRIFRVAPEDVERTDAWLDEPGWYVDTVRPPASWISNDPLGPYATLAELQADTFPSYRDEEV